MENACYDYSRGKIKMFVNCKKTKQIIWINSLLGMIPMIEQIDIIKEEFE